MIDVLVIVLAVVVVAAVFIGRTARATRTRSGRGGILAALAPVVDGAVSGEQVLSGRYRGYDVEVLLHAGDPSPPDLPDGVSSERYLVQVVRIRLQGAPGAQPWSAWASAHLAGRRTWRFAGPGPAALGHLSRRLGIPEADPGLPDLLRSAGIEAAFDRLQPDTRGSFPRIRYTPDLRPFMEERLRAVADRLPPSARQRSPEEGPWLEVEVERTDDADPTPERFREILDVAAGIAEINARANPVERTPT